MFKLLNPYSGQPFYDDQTPYKLNFVNELNPDVSEFTHLESSNSDVEILAWFNDGTVYIYSPLDKLFMNENSALMFDSMCLDDSNINILDGSSVVELTGFLSEATYHNLDLTTFNFNKVERTAYMFAEFRSCY